MIPLEDNFADILGKALRGKDLSTPAAAKSAGLSEAAVDLLLAGQFDPPATRALATVLQLNGEALVRLARGDYRPHVDCPLALVAASTPYGDLSVNAYILWDEESRDAAIFDTGADATPLLQAVASRDLNVLAIFLTHSHADHVHALAVLQGELKVEAWSSALEPVRGTKTFRPGDLFKTGRHFIRTRLTPGHSPGGTTYVIEGALLAAAMVGDAIFAGSIGTVRDDYQGALAQIRREILGLSDHTILCPGHGPLTTVAEEKAHNPFFA